MPRDAPPTILATHNYVIAEALALVHRRLGTEAVRALIDGLFPALSVLFVDQPIHDHALRTYRESLARRSSFVDHVSFEVMHQLGIRHAFAFDPDFARQGFELVP